MLRTRVPLLLALVSAHLLRADGSWHPLFNGHDLAGWSTFLAAPPAETDVPGLKRDKRGAYLEPIGFNRDPLKVFTIVSDEGRPAIHVSGAGFGVMMTDESFANFHLRLQVKWGEKKWGYKLASPRDAGLLYFARGPAGVDHATWPRCLEFQIQERDFGDLFTLGSTTAEARARQEGRLWLYDPTGTATHFVARRPIGARCVRLEDCEKPHGVWNSLDLVCLGDGSIHVVNGKVVMRLNRARIPDGEAMVPLNSGHVCLQTEGAEVFYRDIEVRTIAAVPPEFAVK